MNNEKEFKPQILSLEEIVQRQEMAKYGKVLTKKSVSRKTPNTIFSIPIKK